MIGDGVGPGFERAFCNVYNFEYPHGRMGLSAGETTMGLMDYGCFEE